VEARWRFIDFAPSTHRTKYSVQKNREKKFGTGWGGVSFVIGEITLHIECWI
jgi:hypothetical protein